MPIIPQCTAFFNPVSIIFSQKQTDAHNPAVPRLPHGRHPAKELKSDVKIHGLVSYTHANNDGKPARTDYANGIYGENVYDALDRTAGIKYNGIVRYSVTYNFYQNNTYQNYNYAY